jgi:hypothetical protein
MRLHDLAALRFFAFEMLGNVHRTLLGARSASLTVERAPITMSDARRNREVFHG